MSHFPNISPKQSFPALESEVLAFWKANDTFKKSIESRPENNPYRFYDGPPFITGTPHYGSLLSSVVKGVGIVMVCQLKKKFKKSLDLLPTKKSKNAELKNLSTDVMIILAPLRQNGIGILIKSGVG